MGTYNPSSSELQLRSFQSRLRRHRNLIAHERTSEEPFVDDLRQIEPILQLIESTLDLIDSQETDQKFEAVANRLRDTGATGRSVVITTTFRATAEYLATSLEELPRKSTCFRDQKNTAK